MNSEIEYITPTDAELSARKKRNYAIAGCLLVFVTVVFFVMLQKSGFFAA